MKRSLTLIRYSFIYLLLGLLLSLTVNLSAKYAYGFLVVDTDNKAELNISVLPKTVFQENFQSNYKTSVQLKGNQAGIDLNNIFMHSLQLRFASSVQTIEVNKIQLKSFFHPTPTVWPAEKIIQNFDIDVPYKLSEDKKSLVLYLKASEAVLSLRENLKSNLSWQWRIGPWLIAGLFCLMLANTRPAQWGVVADLNKPSNIAALDGLRGLAALVVLVEHTMYRFHGIGHAGVWLFFVLSGFLLSKPFAKTPEVATSLVFIKDYLIRRMKRILPAYYLIIFLVFIFHNLPLVGIRHMLFMQGDLHLWTILHEVYFYMLLPFLAMLVYCLCRGSALTSALVLWLLSLVWLLVPENSHFGIYGYARWMKPYFDVFIVGMVAGYLYYGLLEQRIKAWHFFSNAWHFLFDCLALLLLAVFFIATFQSSGLLNISGVFEYFRNFYNQAVVAALIILYAACSKPTGLFNRIFTFPALRYIGVVGYSFYLLHPFIINQVHQVYLRYFIDNEVGEPISGLVLALVSLVFSVLFASMLYTFIERPFLKSTKHT